MTPTGLLQQLQNAAWLVKTAQFDNFHNFNTSFKYYYQPHTHLINYLPPSIHYLLIKDVTPEYCKLHPHNFQPFTVFEINDQSYIVTYHDISFETILKLSVNDWYSLEAIGSAIQLHSRFNTKNATNENFTITILNNTYFIGELHYDESRQYGELGTITRCFPYKDNSPLTLNHHTPTAPRVTPIHIKIKIPQPTHVENTPAGNKPIPVPDERIPFYLQTSNGNTTSINTREKTSNKQD